jgi:hypothetical protein
MAQDINQNIDMQTCVDDCQECWSMCTATVQHCLHKGGRHAEADHIRLLLDCADICKTAADFMLRGSDLHPQVCEICATVCDRCADSCDQMADDDTMRDCSEVCRRCADSCRQMSTARV